MRAGGGEGELQTTKGSADHFSRVIIWYSAKRSISDWLYARSLSAPWKLVGIPAAAGRVS